MILPISDALGRRMPILVISTFITVILTAMTGYAGLMAALGYSVLYLLPYMIVKMVLLAIGITVSAYIITRPTAYIQ